MSARVGGTCTTPSFNLAAGASCSVNLQINADELRGNLIGGPVVCNTLAHPIYCSKPSVGNELNIVKSTNPPPLTTLSISVSSPPPAVITVNGTGVTLTIENTGDMTAYNVMPTLPSSWHGVGTVGSCGNIMPGAANACTLTFTATLPNLVNTIGFGADNAPVVQSPAIAFIYGGGLVFSVSTSPAMAKSVTPSDFASPYAWDPNCNTTSCIVISWSIGNPSDTNGSGNTIDIVNSIGPPITPPTDDYAAYQCNQLTTGGASSGEWYLPAICELGSPGNEAGCPVMDNVYTNLVAFGFGDMGSTAYWSSTEPAFDQTLAWVDDFIFLGEFFGYKGNPGQVRCVRIIPY